MSKHERMPGEGTDHTQPLRKRWSATPLPQISAYVGESAVRLLLTGVVGVFIARYLGPRDLGLLSFAIGVFALLAPLSSLGMRSVLVREFSVDRNWRPVLVAGLSRQIPSALAASILATGVLLIGRGTGQEVFLLAMALFPLPLLSLGDMMRALFEAHDETKRIAGVAISAAMISSTLKLLAIALDWPIWVFALLVTAESGLVALGFTWKRLRTGVIASLRTHYSSALAKRLVRESWPLLLAGVAVTVYMKIDIAMLGLLAGDFETGIYAAATRLSEVWYFIPVAAAAALRPRLSMLFGSGDLVSYRILTQRFISGSFLIAASITTLVMLLATPLIMFVYGAEFITATPVLRLHVLAAPFVYIGVASSQWFIDHRLTRAVMLRSSAAAIVNVVLNLMLIPILGAEGAAISTLVSQAFSGLILNYVGKSTRPLFRLQLRGLRGAWR